MTINGYCQNCGNQFDAHWSKVERSKKTLKPICPRCHSENTHTRNDECNDAPDYPEREEHEMEIANEN